MDGNKSRMIMDEVQKTRQLMLKQTRPPKDQPNVGADPKSLAMLKSVEVQNSLTTFVANTSIHGNPIIAVFPRVRVRPTEDDKDKDSGSST